MTAALFCGMMESVEKHGFSEVGICMKKYIFRKIKREEIPQMFALILRRIAWMDEKGIKQWNVTNYADAYPEAYYYKQCEMGTAYVLAEEETGEVVCAAILLETDERWNDDVPAMYLHNFVSKVGEKGVGTTFLRLAEEYAIVQKKHYFRLDSAVDNKALTEYYESHGFMPVGECQDGPYRGILRQKELGTKEIFENAGGEK